MVFSSACAFIKQTTDETQREMIAERHRMTIKLSKHGQPLSDLAGTIAILDTVHGRASRWTIGTATLSSCVEVAEAQMLNDGLSRSSMVGTEISILSAGPVSKAYRFSVLGSHVGLKCTRTGWRMITAQCVRRYPGQKEEVTVKVTSVAFGKMVKKLEARYRVQPPAGPEMTLTASNDR
jgi:hypothetical protein